MSARPQSDTPAGPLAGVRILDLSTVVMGPYATQVLADLGADVIKVEPPAGDNMRAVGPMRNPGMGHIYLHLNRNKRSVVLDLKTPEGLEACLKLAESCDALSLHHVRAREWKGDLVLLHELAEGPADRSYGLAVARLAGIPAPVIARAKTVLDRLEKGRAETGGLAAGLGELPLFAAAAQAQAEQSDTLRDKLQDLDIDALSPREALDLLYDLKREAGADGI